ncbi:MAG: FAD-binding protein [Chloroflexi bacterium]|nr:FAD-binding protein [Chloroflexota bacterium]
MLVRDARWKESADIVILGYGGAGAVAAITAHDLGAEVLLVEKQAQDSHYTNTQMSAGNFICPNDVNGALRYMEAICRVEEGLTWTDRDTLHAWAEYTSQNIAWLEAMGGHIKPGPNGGEHRKVEGWESIGRAGIAGSGLGLHRLLTSNVARRGIRVLFDTPAQKLLTDSDGRVVGVRVAVGEGREAMDIKANRAVIMTLGGFEFDESMKLNYLRVFPTYFYGTTANTGDGHRMVMDMGADLWHMNCCSARLVAKFPDFPIAFSVEFSTKFAHHIDPADKSQVATGKSAGYVLVDRDGRRFTSENIKFHTLYYELALFDSHRLIYPRVPCHLIFDQARMDAGPIPSTKAGPAGPVQLYHWSKDNQAELERGWIVKGDTVDELADKIGVPAANLAETVRRYNIYCREGHDPEFNRHPSDLTPFSQPPFYALRLYPGGPNTQGGPRRNHRAQVLNVDGDPVRRLYAAGEFGSVYGMLYPAGGGNIAECIAFGRIAAENAVREEPMGA